MSTLLKPKRIVRSFIAILLVLAMLLSLVSCTHSNQEEASNKKYPPETVLPEDMIAEQLISEKVLSEFFIEEKQIIEDKITETLLQEKNIEEVYYVEVYYVPEEFTYSYFDNDTVSNQFGTQVDINSVVTKLAVGSGVLLFAAALQYAGIPSTVVIQGVVGSGIGAGVGAGIGGIDAAISKLDESGRLAASAKLGLSIAGCICSALAVSTAVSTGGASLVLAGIFLAASAGGTAYSATECVKKYQSTSGVDIDWNNINWDDVGYAAIAGSIEGVADGFMAGAIVGTAHGSVKPIDNAIFRNSLPKKLRKISLGEADSLKSGGFTKKQLEKMEYDPETGLFYYKMPNADMAGKTKTTPGGRVKYIKKTVKLKGVDVEVVVADFKPYAKYEYKLSKENFTKPDYAKECNDGLKQRIQNDPDLKAQFTPAQVKAIEAGKTPPGYVWHHSEEEGVLQLVPREVHDGARHGGGNSLWGANQE